MGRLEVALYWLAAATGAPDNVQDAVLKER